MQADVSFSQLLQAETGITGQPAEQMAALAARLMAENEKYNLTALREPAQVARLHFADSLTALETGLFKKGAKVADVGTGAGFPGLPLAILLPDCLFTLVESVGKKARFVQDCIGELGLKNTVCLAARAEELGRLPAHRAAYDIVVSRAAAPLPLLLELCLPLLKTGGSLIAYKGRGATEELAAAQNALQLLRGRAEIFTPVKPVEGHVLILAEKTGNTPPAFPRPYRQMARQAL